MKLLIAGTLLLLAACGEHPVAWDLAYATYTPEHVSGSDEQPGATR